MKKPKQDSVKLGEQMVPYQVKESDRARNIRLKISPEKGLEVVVPPKYPLVSLEPLLKSRESWILQKLDLMNQRARQRKENSLAERQAVSFLGKSYRLVTVFQEGPPVVDLVGDKILVMLPQAHKDKVRQVLESWLRHQARDIILERVEMVRRKLRINYNQVFIKDQKTRWGSCSSQGNLNFNFRLVMAPLPVIDYLVAHEMAHLVEMNHSKKFWSLVESICPEYKKHRQWLKDHGAELIL
ncbi:MAG: M48 family metallopeptidase [Bacillota bacterium]|nr:M48 family metallopeptidase [Bacillota bacterium]